MKKSKIAICTFLPVLTLLLEYRDLPFTQMNFMLFEFLLFGIYVYTAITNISTTTKIWTALIGLWIIQSLCMAGNLGNMTRLREHEYVLDVCHIVTYNISAMLVFYVLVKTKKTAVVYSK